MRRRLFPSRVVNLTGLLYAEVALSQIVPAFQLAPTEAEIVWGIGGPMVKESVNSFSHKLPIKISRA